MGQQLPQASAAEVCLFDQVVSASNHRGWHGYSERLGCLEIDADVETRRLLEWQVRRLLSPQNAINKRGRAIVNLIKVWAVVMQLTVLRIMLTHAGDSTRRRAPATA